jgi:histidyl-tRNA synthetase
LSEESRIRLQKNPLRILDSKDETDKKLSANAPGLSASMTVEASAFYESLKDNLAQFGVPFVENPAIVRGLDYYNHTAFEFVTSALGAQGTVMGGGRYNGLVEQLGGPNVPGIGWGAGIERLAMLLPESPAVPVPVVVMGARAVEAAIYLRAHDIRTEIAFQGNIKNAMKYANRIGAAWVVLANAEGFALKNLDDGAQSDADLATIAQTLLAG